ncbi:MAG: hypothetical protein EBZ48_07595, partial [Proteobacteria bacterium]|nr:hypothetical protein [Pseudomonadota bacterium]
MQQLTLSMLPKVVYRPEQFVAHSGVASILTEAHASVTTPRYGAVVLTGPARCGKTHFVIALAAELGAQGLFPRFIEGGTFAQYLVGQGASCSYRSDEILIIDDMHLYLDGILPGESGPFVHFVERVRTGGAHLLLTSRVLPREFNCDGHVMSRLSEAAHLQIMEPDEATMPMVLTRMAQQRGIKLTSKKVEFLQRRMRRSIPSIEEYLEKVVHLSAVLGGRVSLSLLGDAL